MKTSLELLKECDELKKKLATAGSPLNNNEVWSLQHQFQVACGQLLVEFQDFALEKGIDRELWNIGFRNNINQLQSQTQSKKKEVSEAREVLNWFLNSASGFYLQLFNQICSFNSLDLVFRRKDNFYGMLGGGLSMLPESSIKKANAKNSLYLCQYCLIHLGDLARYRHNAKQSETFYRHAVTVSATSGHPYNQLALLEAGRGNRLAAVFLYIRALCVPAPFTGAPSNLAQTLTKILTGRTKDALASSGEIKMGTLTRMTKEEYVNLFLQFHSSLLLKGEIDSAKNDLSRLTSALSTLVATTALTRSSLVHMFTINFFSMLYFSGKVNLRVTDETQNKKDEELLVDPKTSSECQPILEDLMVGMLAALLLPIHTMKDPEVVLTFTAIPAIRLTLEWILIEEKLLCPALKKKQQIWPGLCTLVNFLQQPLQNFDSSTYEEVPLPEDWDLQGFQPLNKLLSRCRFRESSPKLTPDDYGLLRAYRLTELAKKFSMEDLEGGALIRKCSENEGEKLKFEAQGHQSPPEEDVLNLERLTLHPPAVTEKVPSTKKEKKVGILKPEGSLERAKEAKESKDPHAVSIGSAKLPAKGIIVPPSGIETHLKVAGRGAKFQLEEKKVSLANLNPPTVIPAMPSDCLALPSARPKTRTNVALQAILKRNSNNPEMKQVSFQSCSPTTSPNPSDASNESQRSQLSTPPLSVCTYPIEVKPPSPLQNLPLSSQSNSGSFILSKPPPNVGKIPLNQPPPTYRWQEGPPPPIHPLSSRSFAEGSFSSSQKTSADGSHLGVKNPAKSLGHQNKSPPDPSMGRFSNLDLRNQSSANSSLSSNPSFRITQPSSLFTGDVNFQKNETALPLYAGRFPSPPGPTSSWDRQLTTDRATRSGPAADSILQNVLPNTSSLQHHSLVNRQPSVESHFKDVVKFPDQQEQNSLAHQLKASLITNPYQIQLTGQQVHYPMSDTSAVASGSIRQVQRTSPPMNSPYLENSQIPAQKSRSGPNFPPSSNSLFTQSSTMNESQPLPSHSSNYFPNLATSGGGWWQNDPTRTAVPEFPQMVPRPPPGRNVPTAAAIDMRPPIPPGIHPQYQNVNLSAAGGPAAALYSAASSAHGDQGTREMAENSIMRGSSTYSLFGPLGSIDPPNHPNHPLPQQLLFSSTPQPLQQNLWSGPSPLERLLEQKKFASGK